MDRRGAAAAAGGRRQRARARRVLLLPHCTRLVFLDPGVDACIANARARPWEPHEHESQAARDAGLDFLIGWIRDYAIRDDEMSLAAHRTLYDGFAGAKVELASREAIAAFQ